MANLLLELYLLSHIAAGFNNLLKLTSKHVVTLSSEGVAMGYKQICLIISSLTLLEKTLYFLLSLKVDEKEATPQSISSMHLKNFISVYFSEFLVLLINLLTQFLI